MSVIGWHTGTVGKVVFFLGLLTVVLIALREFGIELPAAVPEGLLRAAESRELVGTRIVKR